MSFYSPIDRLAQNLPRPKGTGAEFMTELSKMPGYKAQEAEDRGLQALMNLPKMERAQFLEIMRLAKPAVVPKARDTQEEHHEEYTLPGGTNYREILLQHPNPKAKFQGVNAHFGGAPNILASVRAKDRTGPNGEKILHIEELQSDWHQQGREKGYASPETADRIKAAERAHRELKQQLEEAKDASSRFEQYLKDPSPVWQNPAAQERVKNSLMEENNKVMELMPQVMKAEAAHQDLLHQSRVPDAPFKKNWHEMALKKMIHHAAENGYDSIAITPGAEQADRYGLAQHIGVLSYDPERQHFAAFKPNRETAMHEHGATPERVSQLVGKELAQKLMASPRQGGFHYLEGDDIKVGGEGMKGFYDKIVPNFLNQFGKKYGAKVGTVPIESGEEMIPDNAGLGQIRSGKPSIVKLHHFPITPEMREDVTKNGVPLYAKGGEVEVKPTSYDPNLQRRHPELEAAIRGIAAGTTTHKQLDKLIAKHKPIKPYEFVPKPATLEDAQRGLNKNQIKAWRAHEDWPEGTPIGGRLDINAYEHHGVWANSIHDESGEKRPTSYGPVISIKNVTFDPNPGKSEEVGTGEKRKSPFARIKGELHHMTEDEAVQHMVDNLHHPDYAQVGYDPRRHGHFYDRKTLQPVTHSPHVVQIGPLALAHKPTYGKRETYA